MGGVWEKGKQFRKLLALRKSSTSSGREKERVIVINTVNVTTRRKVVIVNMDD